MTKVAVTRYKDLTRWDVKSYLYTLNSNYPIVSLASYLIENTTRVKPFDFPDQEFDILGVTNKNGIYFNETLLGSKINQPYYQVDGGDTFYNPYRVNVGSIGLVPQEFHHKYTSPAYVVFRTKQDELLSEYLLLVMKSDWFNEVLRAFTSGSVRQNLTFSLLGDLKVPLPLPEEQKKIIALWHKAQSESKAHIEQAENLKKEIDDYLMSELGITVQKQEKSKVFTTRYKDLERWSLQYNSGIVLSSSNIYNTISVGYIIENSQYGLSLQSSEKGKIPFLRMNNIINGSLNFDNLKYIDECTENYFLEYEDLLFNRTNSKELVGKTALFYEKGIFTFASYLIRAKINRKFAIPYYINELFNHSIVRQQIDRVSRQITGQVNVNAQEMKNIKIPLPPLKKQQEIVEHITKLRTQISELQTKAQDTISSARETIKNQIIK